MTDRQLIAIRTPIASPTQSSNPLFHRSDMVGGRLISSIITVNRCLDFNDGRAVWHAGASILDFNRMGIPLKKLSDSTVRALIVQVSSLLEGVGQFPSAMECFERDIHYRRSLTDEELARLIFSAPYHIWKQLPATKRGRGTILGENI